MAFLLIAALGVNSSAQSPPTPTPGCAGSLDPSFGAGGRVFTDFANDSDSARVVAIQSDGHVIVAGYSRQGRDGNGVVDFALARYNPNGTLDTSFGTGGRVTTDFANKFDAVQAIAIQPDSKIIAAGETGGLNEDFALARYNPDGTLDTSFGTGGRVTTDIFTENEVNVGDGIFAIALQPDGKIVAAGGTYSAATGLDFAVVRYNADGTLDTTFGTGGIIITDFSGNGDEASGVAILPDGTILVGGVVNFGNSFSSDPTMADFGLARYNANGTLDTSFGTGGKVTTDFANNADVAYTMARQPDGKIILAGYYSVDSGISGGFALARYNADGSLDATFGAGGRVTTDLSIDSEVINGIALQTNGKIVAGGTGDTTINGSRDNVFAVVRYNLDGTLDTTFGTGGIVIDVDGPYTATNSNSLAIQQDGDIIAAGFTVNHTTGGDFALARYTTCDADPTPTSQLLNISTRLRVQTGENVLIGGLIVTGSAPKRVILRAIGPSLSQVFDGALADPILELYQGDTLIASNDNWRDSQQAEIEATGIPPSNDLESAIVRTLSPDGYTAILRGSGDSTGIGVVEAYDLDRTANSKLGNIATRGFVDTDDNVMIGGLIVGPAGGESTRVVVRAIGPTLTNFGIAGVLQDPTLELRSGDGTLIRSNDNWKDSQQTEITQTGLNPSDDRESALLETVAPGNYTAIVRGAGDTTGVGLVEVYNVP